MTTFVLIWAIISVRGLTSGTAPFVTQEACEAAAVTLKNADHNWGDGTQVTAACIPDTIPADVY